MTRFAVLVKQIPAVDEVALGSDGRLERDAAALEMSAYCRRAVSKAVELATDHPNSEVVIFTLGPPPAEDVLREAIAWGLDRGAEIRGVLISDPAFAGSDTIATARTVAAAIVREGPFDLILTGKNSLDADTGQVGPQLAELLDLPFVAGVKAIDLDGDTLTVGCEHDDSWIDAKVRLPAILSCAERLCEPAKVPPAGCAAVSAGAITTLSALEAGPGPWGAAASLTAVGEIRRLPIERARQRNADAPLAVQVAEVVQTMRERRALDSAPEYESNSLGTTGGPGPVIAVIADRHHHRLTQEMCGAATRLAERVSGSTAVLAADRVEAATAGSWGADRIIYIDGGGADEDIASAVAAWACSERPWAILAGSTTSGREIAARVAAAIGAGLTGDAVDFDVADGRLIAWKPAFGGSLVAAISAMSPVQMATVRPGVLRRPRGRAHIAEVASITAARRGRVTILSRRQDDSLERLESAVVIGVGAGFPPGELARLNPLRDLLSAEIGCTRKVTDHGWMPHSRQIGITGRSISPRLYIAIGTSGKFNHMAGVRSAGTVLAINPDPDAPVWMHADVGIVADWRDCIDLLEAEIRRTKATP